MPFGQLSGKWIHEKIFEGVGWSLDRKPFFRMRYVEATDQRDSPLPHNDDSNLLTKNK